MFRNINKLFALLIKNGNNDLTRDSFDKYYMPLIEIKDFDALIDKNNFSISQWKKTKTKCV